MRKRLLTFLAGACFGAGVLANADVQVAFFEHPQVTASPSELEPNGRYHHVAISVGRQWLHAHPWRGVELVDQIGQIGQLSKLIHLHGQPAVQPEEVRHLIGRPYNLLAPWHSDESYNCSKLVGQLLGITPRPMTFSGAAWRGIRNLPRGELGLSPDDIHRWLTRWPRWGPTQHACRSLFNSRALPY